MQRFEYLMVAHVNYRAIIVGERTYEQETGPHIADVTNELGNEGWEMVDAQYSRADGGYVGDLWFKRVLP